MCELEAAAEQGAVWAGSMCSSYSLSRGSDASGSCSAGMVDTEMKQAQDDYNEEACRHCGEKTVKGRTVQWCYTCERWQDDTEDTGRREVGEWQSVR